MAQRVTESDFTLDTAAELAAYEEPEAIRGRSPWYLAWRRLRRNYVAFFFLFVFIAVVVACALAPVYAKHVAGTGPNTNHILEVVKVNGKPTQVVSSGGLVDPHTGKLCQPSQSGCELIASIPIAPTWFGAGGKFVLGADQNGRDWAVRLLYGGRTSLFIGIVSSAICVFFAVILALLAAYYGGWCDFTITRFFDLMFAFPVILLAIALGSALSINGFHHFGINIESGNIWIPTLIISYVSIPYLGRPLRGQLLSLREKEFVEASISQGASPYRVMFVELLPNIASSVLVFFTLIIAANILLETALSFLGAGVQPPTASWGTMIADGQNLIVTRPWLSFAPGIAIIITVVSLNVFGDGLRDALDPRAKVKI
ncbi:MAG: ABC transporter permease [Ilumatobacteraceae bacterium]